MIRGPCAKWCPSRCAAPGSTSWRRSAAFPRLTASLARSIAEYLEMPLTSVVEMEMKTRDDVVTDGGYPQKIVQNAPATEDNFFLVPKVVE